MAYVVNKPSIARKRFTFVSENEAQLFKIISECVEEHKKIKIEAPIYRDFRLGDVLHSLADINKAKKYLGYEPSHRLIDGIKESMAWYLA
jgi:UDP-N-acetylglucosamine 4-epimerase